MAALAHPCATRHLDSCPMAAPLVTKMPGAFWMKYIHVLPFSSAPGAPKSAPGRFVNSGAQRHWPEGQSPGKDFVIFSHSQAGKQGCYTYSSVFTLWMILNKDHNVIVIIMLPITHSGLHHGWCVCRFCRSKNLSTAESRFKLKSAHLPEWPVQHCDPARP